MKKLKMMKENYGILIVYAKVRLLWVLYNLIYIHILRAKHPNETFERISFNKLWDLVMDDIYQQLGLVRENRVS